MVVVQVKKVVAVCFLEAARLTLDHLAEHRLTFSTQGESGAGDLPRLYGDARRLRDYLQRCASGPQDLVDLEFGVDDAKLLVACCRRYVEIIDQKIVGEQAATAEERQWLLRKRTVLSDWAVELTTAPPLLDLPLPHLAPVPTEGVKALSSRLHQKLFDGGHQRRIAPVGANSTAGVSLATRGTPPLVPAAGKGPTGLAALWGGEEHAVEVIPQPPLLDPKQLRDPRLRSLCTVDLGSYERAVASQDLRLAAVLLGAILETAVIDHALPRRAQLGLQSTPDTWPMHEVLAKIMADQLQPQDKPLCYHAFTARNLLRPALQMVTPTVVTQVSLERLQDLARRALHTMGYAAISED